MSIKDHVNKIMPRVGTVIAKYNNITDNTSNATHTMAFNLISLYVYPVFITCLYANS